MTDESTGAFERPIAYDLNGNGGVFPIGVTTPAPVPFALNDANTLTFLGNVFKRTQPN